MATLNPEGAGMEPRTRRLAVLDVPAAPPDPDEVAPPLPSLRLSTPSRRLAVGAQGMSHS